MKTASVLLFVASACLRATSISASIGSASLSQSIDHPGSLSFSAPGASADVGVDFGGASAEGNSNCGFVNDCSASAGASFSDAITIFGINGFLRASINAMGGENTGRADTRFAFGSFVGGTSGNQTFLPPCIFTGTCQQAFSAGIPTSISGQLTITAADIRPQDPFDGSSDAHAAVGFRNFSVLNELGQPLTGFRYTSDSLTDYHIAGGTFVAPEPATWPMMLVGLVAVISVLRRKVDLG
jgi:hypothetical protein